MITKDKIPENYKNQLSAKDKEISDLKKKKLELKQGLLKISNKLVLITKCWIEHESLDKLREQKLANRDREWIGKINGIIMRCEKDGEFSSDYQKHLALGLKRLKQEMGVKRNEN